VKAGAAAGHTLLEVLFALGTVGTLAGMAVPPLLAGVDGYRTAGAVRYLSARMQKTRLDALARSVYVALQFVPTTTGYSYAPFADGNTDGVRTADIRSGIDQRLGAVERIGDNFTGVEIGLLPGLPPVDPGGVPPGTDPVKFGAGNLLSFSPTGGATSGSLYVRGRGQVQYVIRVLGDTGRVRVLRFDPRSRQWKPS
jgi:type II secretory pathway pseudopilin PulG